MKDFSPIFKFELRLTDIRIQSCFQCSVAQNNVSHHFHHFHMSRWVVWQWESSLQTTTKTVGDILPDRRCVMGAWECFECVAFLRRYFMRILLDSVNASLVVLNILNSNVEERIFWKMLKLLAVGSQTAEILWDKAIEFHQKHWFLTENSLWSAVELYFMLARMLMPVSIV